MRQNWELCLVRIVDPVLGYETLIAMYATNIEDQLIEDRLVADDTPRGIL